jgi:hypothetical protein
MLNIQLSSAYLSSLVLFPYPKPDTQNFYDSEPCIVPLGFACAVSVLGVLPTVPPLRVCLANFVLSLSLALTFIWAEHPSSPSKLLCSS